MDKCSLLQLTTALQRIAARIDNIQWIITTMIIPNCYVMDDNRSWESEDFLTTWLVEEFGGSSATRLIDRVCYNSFKLGVKGAGSAADLQSINAIVRSTAGYISINDVDLFLSHHNCGKYLRIWMDVNIMTGALNSSYSRSTNSNRTRSI